MKQFSPINLDTPIAFNDPLPDEIDVVVVGGGVIGVSTALELIEQGLKVLLLEKGRIAGEQSSRNWGWIRQTGRDAAELPIMIDSLEIWKDLAARTGENALSFSEQGVVYLASTEKELATFEAFVSLAKAHSVDSRLLSQTEVAARYPKANHRWLGGLHTPSDGRAEPWHAVPALARSIHRRGVLIREHCAVRQLLISNGRISGVYTEQGEVKADRVLICGGAWTSLLAREAKVNIPQLSVKSTVIRIDSVPEIGQGNSVDERIAFAQRDDGGYTVALGDHHDFYIGPDAFRHLLTFRPAVKSSFRDTRFFFKAPTGYPDAWGTPRRWSPTQESPFEHTRILNPQVDTGLVDEMLRRLKRRFPSLENISVSHQWAGMIDTMPDFVPVMDESHVAGLFIATGFSGHGFGIGPGAGQVMGRLIANRSDQIEHDLSRFSYSRFSDGSSLVLGPH